MDLIPNEKSLVNMKKKSTEGFREYAIRWSEQAARVKPPIKESKLVEVFIQAQDETYFQYLLPIMGKSFIEVLKMGEMIEDEIKTDRIVSFTALKATTQAIQGGSGAFGGRKKKEDVATVIAGTHPYPKRPTHPYPQSQAQIYIQAPYIPPHHYYPPQNPLYFIPPYPYLVYARSHMPKPLLTRNGAHKPHKITHSLHRITKTPPDLVFNLGPSIRKRRRSKINSHLLASHMLYYLIG